MRLSRLAFVLAASLVSTAAFAQARIHAVSYDLVTGTLVITGEDLKGTLAATTVKLGGTSLNVLANTATSLTAQMPPNQAAGEYLIHLKRGLLTVLEAVALSEATFSLSIIQPMPGPAGEQGPQGPAGMSGYTVMNAVSPNDSSESRILTANCPAGKTALGGGHLVSPVSATTYRAISVPASRPLPGNNGWTAAAIETQANYTANWQFTVYAICATLAP